MERMISGLVEWFAIRTTLVGVLAVAACDGVSGSGDNHPPVMDPQSLVVDEDKALRIELVATDEDGDDLHMEIFGPGAQATLEISRIIEDTQSGTTVLQTRVFLVPDRNFFGKAGFPIQVFDDDTHTDVYIDVEVLPINDKPIGVGDAFAASLDTPLQIFHSTLLANDLDGDGDVKDKRDVLTISAVGASTHGTATLGPGIVTFIPETGFAGTASFEYTVNDGAATNLATVRILVGGPNAAPIAKDDVEQIFTGQTLTLGPSTLTENDTDPDGQTLAVSAVGNATHGTVDTVAGVVTFTPEAWYSGPAGFEYTVTDGVATDVGYVTVQIADPI